MGFMDTVLDRILDSPIPVPDEPLEMTWLPGEESKFRRFLASIKLDAKIVRNQLWIKPKEPAKFELNCKMYGLGAYPMSMFVASEAAKGYWIRFVY